MEKNYTELLTAIETALSKQPGLTLAIDGPCASGKTSLAAFIQARFDARIIPMDDFFLPADLRTSQRYATPGGNVHYERFLSEIAPSLVQSVQPSPLDYRPFDCSIMDYGPLRSLPACPLTIVEGTYSLHFSLRHLYDIKVLLNVSEGEQEKRLLKREGIQRFEVFKTRWIPMEKLYFDHAELESLCDFML